MSTSGVLNQAIDERQDTKIIFVLSNEEKIEAARPLNFASGLLQDFLRTIPLEDKQTEIPLENFDNAACINLLNAFMKYLDENHSSELREHYGSTDYWMTEIVRFIFGF